MKECCCFFLFFFCCRTRGSKNKLLTGINVRLARTGGQLGAQCVERKQPPPQDVPSTQPQPRTCVAFSCGASRAFAHAGFETLWMTVIVVAHQSQRRLTPWSLVELLEEGICFLQLHADLFWHGRLRKAAGCCKGTVGNRVCTWAHADCK